MGTDKLTDELKDRARLARTSEEIAELAKEEGCELADEQLTGVVGGVGPTWCYNDCEENLNSQPSCHGYGRRDLG